MFARSNRDLILKKFLFGIKKKNPAMFWKRQELAGTLPSSWRLGCGLRLGAWKPGPTEDLAAALVSYKATSYRSSPFLLVPQTYTPAAACGSGVF